MLVCIRFSRHGTRRIRATDGGTIEVSPMRAKAVLLCKRHATLDTLWELVQLPRPSNERFAPCENVRERSQKGEIGIYASNDVGLSGRRAG